MQKSELIKLLRNPASLDEETLQALQGIKEQYPYFQSVRLLSLKNKFMLAHPDYQQEIETVSAYVSDRSVLYDLLYPPMDETGHPVETDEIAEQEFTEPSALSEETIDLIANEPSSKPSPTLRDNISNLLSWQLEELELMDPNEAELVPEIAVDIDKTYGSITDVPEEVDLLTLESEPEPPQEGEAETAPREKELIEKFIECNPRILPPKDDRPVIDISADSVKEHDGIFTDTLAKIYVKQGYYSKAIFVYEKLILKYPEKRLYFADQIDTIKKLLNKQ